MMTVPDSQGVGARRSGTSLVVGWVWWDLGWSRAFRLHQFSRVCWRPERFPSPSCQFCWGLAEPQPGSGRAGHRCPRKGTVTLRGCLWRGDTVEDTNELLFFCWWCPVFCLLGWSTLVCLTVGVSDDTRTSDWAAALEGIGWLDFEEGGGWFPQWRRGGRLRAEFLSGHRCWEFTVLCAVLGHLEPWIGVFGVIFKVTASGGFQWHLVEAVRGQTRLWPRASLGPARYIPPVCPHLGPVLPPCCVPAVPLDRSPAWPGLFQQLSIISEWGLPQARMPHVIDVWEPKETTLIFLFQHCYMPMLSRDSETISFPVIRNL